jgi:hypothetical protein
LLKKRAGTGANGIIKGFVNLECSMEPKEIFCPARYKHKKIHVSDCIPNPFHPACQKCTSPNIADEHRKLMKKIIKEEELKERQRSSLKKDLFIGADDDNGYDEDNDQEHPDVEESKEEAFPDVITIMSDMEKDQLSVYDAEDDEREDFL